MYWRDRDLPFPVLLDSTGQTIKDYGVRAFPTTILIDPQGKLVGEAREEQLEAKLPELPMLIRLAKALDKNVTYSLDDPQLDQAIKMLSTLARIPIRLDQEKLKAAGVAPSTKVPYKMQGLVSLRSALNLLLDGLGLGYEQDDQGLLITARKNEASSSEKMSEPQRACAERIQKTLNRKVSFDFKEKSLAEIAQHFEQQTQENFVLEPAARRAGLLNPNTLVTGSAKDVPLGEALEKLLVPLGLRFVVRDEVVVLSAKSRAPSAN
jgi:AhpC/TSA family